MGINYTKLDLPVEEYHLDVCFSTRTTNCLLNAHILTMRQLLGKSRADMFRVKNFGRKSLAEIEEVLADVGLRLGMDLTPPPPTPIHELIQLLRSGSLVITNARLMLEINGVQMIIPFSTAGGQ